MCVCIYIYAYVYTQTHRHTHSIYVFINICGGGWVSGWVGGCILRGEGGSAGGCILRGEGGVAGDAQVLRQSCREFAPRLRHIYHISTEALSY